MAELEEDITIEEMPDFQQEPEPKLTESNRRKLDSIVQKMVDNKESDEAISFVVNDFKSKYATKPLAVTHKPKAAEPGREMTGVFGGQAPQFGTTTVTGA